MSLVAWDKVCQPKDRGGLGLRRLRDTNIAFLLKFAWEILSGSKSLWCKVLRAKYGLEEDNISRQIKRKGCSHLWGQLSLVWDLGMKGMKWSIGKGTKVRFWKDVWIDEEGPLMQYIEARMPEEDENRSVASYVNEDGSWRWEEIYNYLPHHICCKIHASPRPSNNLGPDSVTWRFNATGKFTAKSAYNMLCSSEWKWEGPERIKTFLWLMMRGALLTNATRVRRHITLNGACHLCGKWEDELHVFRDCYRATSVWRKLDHRIPTSFWYEKNLQNLIFQCRMDQDGAFGLEQLAG